MKMFARVIFTICQDRKVKFEIDALNRIDQVIQVSYVQVKIVTNAHEKQIRLRSRNQATN